MNTLNNINNKVKLGVNRMDKYNCELYTPKGSIIFAYLTKEELITLKNRGYVLIDFCTRFGASNIFYSYNDVLIYN